MEELYINHEDVSNLQGGDETGHYHLTREQLDWVIEHMEELLKPLIHNGQEIIVTVGEEMDDYRIKSDRT